jgi:hypothetical protein
MKKLILSRRLVCVVAALTLAASCGGLATSNGGGGGSGNGGGSGSGGDGSGGGGFGNSGSGGVGATSGTAGGGSGHGGATGSRGGSGSGGSSGSKGGSGHDGAFGSGGTVGVSSDAGAACVLIRSDSVCEKKADLTAPCWFCQLKGFPDCPASDSCPAGVHPGWDCFRCDGGVGNEYICASAGRLIESSYSSPQTCSE